MSARWREKALRVAVDIAGDELVEGAAVHPGDLNTVRIADRLAAFAAEVEAETLDRVAADPDRYKGFKERIIRMAQAETRREIANPSPVSLSRHAWASYVDPRSRTLLKCQRCGKLAGMADIAVGLGVADCADPQEG